MTTDSGNGNAGQPLPPAPLLAKPYWGMTRITGKLISRADGSFYWKCDDGTEREYSQPTPPLTPDQVRRLWNQHDSEKDEEQNRRQWRLYEQRLAAYIQGQQTIYLLMDQAIQKRCRCAQSTLRNLQVETRLLFRRIFHRLARKLWRYASWLYICLANGPDEPPGDSNQKPKETQ
jgi:hypothetical protein